MILLLSGSLRADQVFLLCLGMAGLSAILLGRLQRPRTARRPDPARAPHPIPRRSGERLELT